MPAAEESILQSIIKSHKVMSHRGKHLQIIQTAIPNQNSMLLQEIKYYGMDFNIIDISRKILNRQYIKDNLLISVIYKHFIRQKVFFFFI